MRSTAHENPRAVVLFPSGINTPPLAADRFGACPEVHTVYYLSVKGEILEFAKRCRRVIDNLCKTCKM
jgi:hypothetical protein